MNLGTLLESLLQMLKQENVVLIVWFFHTLEQSSVLGFQLAGGPQIEASDLVKFNCHIALENMNDGLGSYY